MLLVTSNGAGMGHLSRQLTVGLAAGSQVERTLLSLSMALPQVLALGVAGEYCPSHERGWMPKWFWNRYLRTRLTALAAEVAADVVVFDGVAPYRGLLAARPHVPDTAFVWLRRGMWLREANDSVLGAASQFDLVVEPGDLARGADRGPTAGRSDAVRVPPISMLEVVDRIPRFEAASSLGLDPDRPTALLTLGSGRLGDVEAPGRVALDAMLSQADWQVAVTTSAIATSGIPIPNPRRVVELSGVYPLVRHLEAFDVVVSAAGYNAVHEFVSGGLPVLLVPNRSTRTDDQVARAYGVGDRGLALVAEAGEPAALREGVERLFDERERGRLHRAIGGLAPDERMGGGRRVAQLSTELAERHRATLSMKARGAWRALDDAARTTIMRALGAGGTDTVRRFVRRAPLGGIGARMPVEVVTDRDASGEKGVTPLLFSEDVTIEDTTGAAPVEHLLPGSSQRYRRQRLAIVERNYRVVEPGKG